MLRIQGKMFSVFFFCYFTADMFAHEDGGPEPDWVRTERDQFSDFRDLNKDGKMDLEEIRHWILPQDYDHAQAEARHLVYESDTDKVSKNLLRCSPGVSLILNQNVSIDTVIH